MIARGGAVATVRVAFVLAVAAADVLTPFAHAAEAAGCPLLPPIAQVLAEDERTRTIDAMAEHRELRDYALFWYRNLAADLVEGRGLSIEVMTHAFGPVCDDERALIDWLRDLILAPGTATDFSRRLVVARKSGTDPD